MRIIDKRRDYYDSLVKAFPADGPTYDRTPHDEEFGGCTSWISIVGFAGKCYPFVDFTDADGQRTFCYDKEVAVKWWSTFEWGRARHRAEWDAMEKAPWPQQFAVAPVWVLSTKLGPHKKHVWPHIYYNPMLHEWGFAKILPPRQAYQELSMYLSSRTARPMPTISDEMKIQAHGFDKNSFRNTK